MTEEEEKAFKEECKLKRDNYKANKSAFRNVKAIDYVHPEIKRKFHVPLTPEERRKIRAKINEDRFNNLSFFKWWCSALKGKAKRDNLPYNLTPEYLQSIMEEKCPILGTEWNTSNITHHTSATVDRLIPSKGYVKGNVVIVSMKANRIKQDALPEEIIRVGEWYKNLFEKCDILCDNPVILS